MEQPLEVEDPPMHHNTSPMPKPKFMGIFCMGIMAIFGTSGRKRSQRGANRSMYYGHPIPILDDI